MSIQRSDLRLLTADAACNGVGNAGEQVLFSLLVFQLSGSSVWVGLTFALFHLPLLLVGVPAGAMADRVDRRSLMKLIELANSAVLGTLALLLVTGQAGLTSVMLLTFLSGSLRAAHIPARSAYVFDLVGPEALVSGLGTLNVGIRAGQLVGALSAGFAMEFWGAGAAYALLAGAHLIGFALLLLLRTGHRDTRRQRTRLLGDVGEYAVELGRNRSLLTLVVVIMLLNVFGFSFVTVLPELAIARFGLGAEALGMMHAARSVGGLVAALLLARRHTTIRTGHMLLLVIAGFGGAMVLLASTFYLLLAVPVLGVIAAAAVSSDVLSQSMMQLCVADRLRGRAMGLWVLAVGATPIGHLEIGAVAGALGAGSALVINGVALVLLAVIAAIAAPRLTRL